MVCGSAESAGRDRVPVRLTVHGAVEYGCGTAGADGNGAENAVGCDAERICAGGSDGDSGIFVPAVSAVPAVLGHASGGDGEYGGEVNREKVRSARDWEIAPYFIFVEIRCLYSLFLTAYPKIFSQD